MLYVFDNAPLMLTPSFFHWYVNPVPVAVTLKFNVPPTHNVVPDGGVVIAAGVLTTTTAPPLVTVAGAHTPLLVTSTVYVPASVVATPTILYVLLVAPPIGVPPFFHW